jgi:hypothetical protein
MLAPDEPDEKRPLDKVVGDAVAAFKKDGKLWSGRIREHAANVVREDEYIGTADQVAMVPESTEPGEPELEAIELERELLSAGELYAYDFRETVAAGQALFPPEGAAPVWGYRKENQLAFETVHQCAVALHAALKAMPGRAQFLMFAPTLSGTNNLIPSAATQKEVERNCTGGVSFLNYLQARCTQLLAAKPGEHKNVRFRQRWVADEARKLLARHGKQATNSSSSLSLFRTTSSLLWEGIFDEQGKDLERACRTVLSTT